MCKLIWTLAALFFAWDAQAQPVGETQPTLEAQSRALQRASDAVVGVNVSVVEDARSAATLGRVRQGSGVVISDTGLVLTIGYLILEAEDVALVTDDARKVPARVVAYDLATGFGLLQALAPLKLAPALLGKSARLNQDDLLMVASGGEEGAVSPARLLQRRAFSGNWEYHLDAALFTAPARQDHSGAGLFNQRGELVGIGSLIVNNALGDNAPRTLGNMFVPVDLLEPVFAEMLAHGRSAQSARAWLGINCAEVAGGVRIIRVSEDSPADVAGLQVGDHIVRIDGTIVATLEPLWKTLWRGTGSSVGSSAASTREAQREVVLDVLRQGRALTLKVQAIDRAMTLRRPQGI